MKSMLAIGNRLGLANLSPRDRRALLVAALLIGPALLYIGAFRPYRAALAETRETIALENRLLERELQLVAAGPILPTRLQQAEQAVRLADARLVRAPNPSLAEAHVTAHLEDLAEHSRVLLLEMRALAIRGETRAGVEPIRLLVRGESDLEGVLAFLNRIEASRLLLTVDEISINPATRRAAPTARGQAQQQQQTGVIDFRMIVDAFTPQPVTGPALPLSGEVVQ